MDQRGLVEQARQGDHDAFSALARESIAQLDAAARLILRDPELARDAVQEAFIRAWLDLAGLRDPDRFDAWMYRLTMNACFDTLRRRRRRPREVELTPLIMPGVADTSAAVAEQDLLDRALRALEPEWRAIVVLYYYVGMPLPEVAEIVGIPLGVLSALKHNSFLDYTAMRKLGNAKPRFAIPIAV